MGDGCSARSTLTDRQGIAALLGLITLLAALRTTVVTALGATIL